MKRPDIPANEKERLNALKEYNILDSLPEEDYDDFTKLASEICDVPIALISLIDEKRQWFKSHHGLNATQTPRDFAFCAHAINEPGEAFIVEDSSQDERFFDNPLVTEDPHVVFYAGIPLITPEGYALGTLCTIDTKPKKLSQTQIDTLKILGKQLINLLELRKKNNQLEAMQHTIQEKNNELQEFAYVVSHDIKSPLININSLAQMVRKENHHKLDKDSREALSYLEESSAKVKELVTDILAYYKGDQLLTSKTEEFDLYGLLNNTFKLLHAKEEIKFNLPDENALIESNKTALKQILINLISNAIKYNYKEKCEISIGFEQDTDFYHFSVKDNGSGIEEENLENIFNLFTNLGKKDRKGNLSTGIGLATVKKIVNKLGGEIKVLSKINEGTKFHFSVKKIQHQQQQAA